MIKNEIVSHNLQLVMDALSEDEYQKFMANYIQAGSESIHEREYGYPHSVIFYGFVWASSIEGDDYWYDIYMRIKYDN